MMSFFIPCTGSFVGSGVGFSVGYKDKTRLLQTTLQNLYLNIEQSDIDNTLTSVPVAMKCS